MPAAGGLRARVVVPVRAGTEWLGSIWAVVDEEPPKEVLRSLRQTASVVALHLLRLRSQADLARRVVSDRLRAVLSGDVLEAEAWLPRPPWRVVVLAGAQGDPASDGADPTDVTQRQGRRPGLAGGTPSAKSTSGSRRRGGAHGASRCS